MFEVAVSVCKTFVITMIKNLRRCGKKRHAEIHFDTFFFSLNLWKKYCKDIKNENVRPSYFLFKKEHPVVDNSG